MIAEELPPHNIEAEQALLGAILTNNDALWKVSPFLKEQHFFEPVHGRIYDAIIKLADKDQAATPVRLKPYFDKDESLNDVGGAQYLVRLAGSAATIINAGEYGKVIYDLAIRRDLMLAGERIALDAKDAPIEQSVIEQIEAAEAYLHELRGYDSKEGQVVRTSAEVVKSGLERFKAAAEAGGIVGLPTGITELDKVFSLAPSEVTIVAGRPAMGKSAFANHVTFAASHGCGVTEPVGAVFFSKEMDGEDNIARAISAQISRQHGRTVPYFRIRKGDLRPNEWELVHEAAEVVSKANISWVDEARLTPSRILSIVRREQRRFQRQGIKLGLVTVDYLQQVKPDARNLSAYDETRIASAAMLELAKQFKIPVLALSQLSRNVEQRDNKRPLMSDMRDSGTIEQDAANIIFPFREEYYLQKEVDNYPTEDNRMQLSKVRGTTELILAKNRNGPLETVIVHSNMAANHYKDMN